MTRQKAVLMMLEISNECNEIDNCRECPFGYGNRCLVSNGNGNPSEWFINEKLSDLLNSRKEEKGDTK